MCSTPAPITTSRPFHLPPSLGIACLLLVMGCVSCAAGASAAAGSERQLAGGDRVSGGAAQLDPHALAALVVAQLDAASALQPALAPLQERGQRREQLDALVREAIALARAFARLAVGLAREQSVREQLAQAGGGDPLAGPPPPGGSRRTAPPRRSPPPGAGGRAPRRHPRGPRRRAARGRASAPL